MPTVGIHDGKVEYVQAGVTSVGVLHSQNKHLQPDVEDPKSSIDEAIGATPVLSPMKTVAPSTQVQKEGDSSKVVPSWVCDSTDSVLPLGISRAAAGLSQQSTVGSSPQMRMLEESVATTETKLPELIHKSDC